MPQIMGSGAALLDIDNDGRLDVYLIHNGGPKSASKNRLFRQGGDKRFTDVSAGSGLDVAGYGMGVACADVTNDGRVDVCLTEYGRARLFVNEGQGRFRDCTSEAGIDNPLWGTSLAFVDYDRDGWLDLIIGNYVEFDPTRVCRSGTGLPDACHPSTFPGTVSKLYRNRGRGPDGAVRFEDATLTSGIGRLPGPALGVACADFTGDRWPDIFVANDAQANRLWVNQQDGTFVEKAATLGVAYNALGNAQANMGVAVGDADRNGLLDLFVTHLTDESHAFWKQDPVGRFRDRTGAAGPDLARCRGTGFGTVFADFDHDGALDLAVVNGRVTRSASGARPAADSFWLPYQERNHLFAGDGTGRFHDVSALNPAICGTPAIGRALACGDVDGDGALDLLVSNVAGPARLYRNMAPDRGHWLMVRATEPARGGRDACGAEVRVYAGERRWLGLINPAHSYLASNDPRAHFGLGAVAAIDRVEVVWPDGTEETFRGPEVDRPVDLRRGEGNR
jgi:hypothetical protein